MRLNKTRVKSAIKDSFGIINLICERCGVTRQALHVFLKKNPEIRKYIEDEQERTLDFAESQLMKLMGQGDFKAVRYYLATKGKSRGYIERVEQIIQSQNDTKIDLAEAYKKFLENEKNEKQSKP